jgi:uncharacterized damage-inducible protein DinB
MVAEVQKIFDRLEAGRKDLIESLDLLHENQFNFKPGQGKWSIAEIIHHLVLSEQGTYRYMTKKNQAEKLPKLGWQASFRSAILNLGLKLPLKYKAPRKGNILPTGKTSYLQLRQEWQEVRGNLWEFIRQLSPERMQSAIFRHPFGGYFTIFQTLRFFEEHIEHHRKQIERIRALEKFP